MFLRVPLLALACALPYSLISATPLPTDNSLITCAGSSGSLNHPAGGFTLTSDPGKGTSYLEVSYNQVRSSFSSPREALNRKSRYTAEKSRPTPSTLSSNPAPATPRPNPRTPLLHPSNRPPPPLLTPQSHTQIPKGLAQLDGSLSDPIKTRFETGTACREFSESFPRSAWSES